MKKLPPWKRRRLAAQVSKIEDRIMGVRDQLEGTTDEGNDEDAYDWLVSATMALQEAMALLDPEIFTWQDGTEP